MLKRGAWILWCLVGSACLAFGAYTVFVALAAGPLVTIEQLSSDLVGQPGKTLSVYFAVRNEGSVPARLLGMEQC